MNPNDPLYFVSFDLYERYAIAAHVVKAFGSSSGPSILDVGGYSERLWPGFQSLVSAFMPDSRSVVVDVRKEPGLANYISGSGTGLPFSDGSFDFVLAQDTLEHIRPEARRQFMRELLRVSRDIVFFSFPFCTPFNQACDRLVYRFIQIKKKVHLQALKEHLELRLPKLSTVRAWVDGTGLPARIWTHGNSLAWLHMMMAKNYFWAQGMPEFGQELDYLFNVRFARGDYEEPCYRCFVLIAKNQSPDRVARYQDAFRTDRPSKESESIQSLCRLMIGAASPHELEQRVQHSINLLYELKNATPGPHSEKLKDLETRLTEKTSEAQHYQNLWAELQEKFADAENRLEQKTSQVGHYENLLEENRQRLADAETRLTEKTSEAQHYQNLCAELQEKFADAGNRLEQKTSQVGHYENLLEENRQRLADAGNRLAEKTSLAEHLQNLLAELQHRLADAENRLVEKTSLSKHHENLLEESRRRLADVEEQVRGKSTEADRSAEEVRALKGKIAGLNEKLAEEQAAHSAAEQEMRALKAKLARFPVRLLVR